jgi:hypothetical protein
VWLALKSTNILLDLLSGFQPKIAPIQFSATGKEAHRVRFVLYRTLVSMGLLGPTTTGLLLIGLGLWGKKKRTPPLGLGLSVSKANRALPWTRALGSKANRTSPPWTRTLGSAPGRALVWTRTPDLVGPGVWRAGSATSQPALGLGKSNLPHRTKKQRG